MVQEKQGKGLQMDTGLLPKKENEQIKIKRGIASTFYFYIGE
jgi:hypothetical protein